MGAGIDLDTDGWSLHSWSMNNEIAWGWGYSISAEARVSDETIPAKSTAELQLPQSKLTCCFFSRVSNILDLWESLISFQWVPFCLSLLESFCCLYIEQQKIISSVDAWTQIWYSFITFHQILVLLKHIVKAELKQTFHPFKKIFPITLMFHPHFFSPFP